VPYPQLSKIREEQVGGRVVGGEKEALETRGEEAADEARGGREEEVEVVVKAEIWKAEMVRCVVTQEVVGAASLRVPRSRTSLHELQRMPPSACLRQRGREAESCGGRSPLCLWS